MTTEYGADTVSGSVNNLVAGPCVTERVPVAAGSTVAMGQVWQYNTGNDNFDDFTSDVTAERYCVCVEETDNGAGNYVAITRGEVFLAGLDATSQADVEIVTALGKCGITVKPTGTR